MKVGVVGAGAVGTAIGSFCQELGLEVSMLGRDGPQTDERRLQIEGGRELVLRGAVHPASDCEILFYCCKAHQLEEAIATHGRRSGKRRCFHISFANGAVWPLLQDKAQEGNEGENWRAGLVTFGVRQLVGSHNYRVTAEGIAAFCSLDGSELSPGELELFRHERFAPLTEGLPALRRKWLFNTVINSISGAFQLVSNGELATRKELVERVFAETMRLGETLHGAWPFAVDELRQGLWQLIDATKNNENSMARDVRLGRSTEVDFLSGLATDPLSFPILCELSQRLRRCQ